MIATNLAALHQGDMIHGDLTTSNMMLRPNTLRLNSEVIKQTPIQIAESGELGILYIIDFGLSCVSTKIEDKATDIYVLKRAFISTHPGSEPLFDKILELYKTENKTNGLKILAKFKEVELRGRKRECFG